MTSLHVITTNTPACFGVCCPQHGQCRRYAAVEHNDGTVFTIASCDDGHGRRPLFLAVIDRPHQPAHQQGTHP